MGDVLEFIFTFLLMSLSEFRYFAGAIATLALGVAVCELWPFDTDKTVIINTLMVVSTALFGGIYLYRRFCKAA